VISTILRISPQKLPATHSVATPNTREPLHGDNAYQRKFQAAANSLAA